MGTDEARGLRDELEALQQALQQALAHGAGEGLTADEHEVARLAVAVAQVEDQLELVRRHLLVRRPSVDRARRLAQSRALPGVSLVLVFAGVVLLAGGASTWSMSAVFAVGLVGAAGFGALAGWRR